jgi:hypothetical protein
MPLGSAISAVSSRSLQIIAVSYRSKAEEHRRSEPLLFQPYALLQTGYQQSMH